MRVKIIPHGSLCDTWPSEFECEARTPFEAFNALDRQFNTRRPGELNSLVEIVGISSPLALHSPCSMPELHVVPHFGGAGGWVKIVIGVIIIVASILTLQPGGVAVGGAWLAGSTVAFAVGLSIGISLALGGLLELISPAPKLNNPKQTDASLYLGVPQNTTQIGTPIPVGYGTFAVYGQFLSYNVQAAQVQVVNSMASASAAGVSLVSTFGGQSIISNIP
jgi:hypothetical protein